jgi:hypothetical protein
MTATTGTTWRLGLRQYSILACGDLLARVARVSIEHLEQMPIPVLLLPALIPGRVGLLTLPCRTIPCCIVRCCRVPRTVHPWWRDCFADKPSCLPAGALTLLQSWSQSSFCRY